MNEDQSSVLIWAAHIYTIYTIGTAPQAEDGEQSTGMRIHSQEQQH